jgi:DNA mismatch endonuclease, patch repair protein
MDIVSPARRSQLMSRIRGADTRPELIVRRLVHSLGFRFRLHRRDLPGTPDLAFPSRRKVVFVHGCFWHRHRGCRFAYTPKSNSDFWEKKFATNQVRDRRVIRRLRASGWDPLIVWECEVGDLARVRRALVAHLRRSTH